MIVSYIDKATDIFFKVYLLNKIKNSHWLVHEILAVNKSVYDDMTAGQGYRNPFIDSKKKKKEKKSPNVITAKMVKLGFH